MESLEVHHIRTLIFTRTFDGGKSFRRPFIKPLVETKSERL